MFSGKNAILGLVLDLRFFRVMLRGINYYIHSAYSIYFDVGKKSVARNERRTSMIDVKRPEKRRSTAYLFRSENIHGFRMMNEYKE